MPLRKQVLPFTNALKGQYILTQGLAPVHPDTNEKRPCKGLITNGGRELFAPYRGNGMGINPNVGASPYPMLFDPFRVMGECPERAHSPTGVDSHVGIMP